MGQIEVDKNFHSFSTSLLDSVRKVRALLFLACFLACLSSVFSLLQPYLTSRILSQITSASLNDFSITIVLVLVLALLAMFACNVIKQYISTFLSERISYAMRERLFSSLSSAPYWKIKEYDQGSIVNRVSRDVETTAKVAVSAFVELPADLILILGCIVGLLITDCFLFIVIVLFVTISLLINVLSSRYISSLIKVRSQRLDELAEVAHSSMRAAASIQTYRVGSEVKSYFNAISANVLGAGKKVGKVASLLQPVSGFLMQLGFLVVIALGGYRVSHGSLEISSLIAFFLYFTYILSPLSGVSVFLNGLADAWAASSRIDEVLTMSVPPRLDRTSGSKDEKVGGNLPRSSSNSLIELTSVSFAFGDGPEIFSNLNFSLPYRGLTLLCGPSGSGKSTLINLLCGQEIPKSGSIRISEDLIDSEGTWCGPNRLLVVPQEYVPWGQTVRDTLTFGRRDISDKKIVNLFHQLNLSHWFESLPNGLGTRQSALDEGASGGELKRLNILRAVLLEPRLLILDEPTASLDVINSQLVISMVNKLRKYMSVLVVTHDNFDWNPDFTYNL